MKPIINNHLSTLPQLQLSTKNTEHLNLSHPKAIEALVISSTPLHTKTDAVKTGQRFLIALQSLQASKRHVFEVIADKAIPRGSRLTIKVSPEQNIQIIAIKVAQNTPATNDVASKTASVFKEQAIIDNLLRQALPTKQAVVKLLPLLQQLTTSTTLTDEPLSKNLHQSINRLLSSVPEAAALQNPRELKRALINNGIFFESKLADFIKSTFTNGNAIKAPAINHLVNQDIKGQLQQLLKLTEQLNAKTIDTRPPHAAKQLDSTAHTYNNSASNHAQQAQSLLTSSASSLTQQPLNLSTANLGSNENAGLMLKQLGRQLLASLAQTQVNQAEILVNRGQLQADGQPAVNHWTFELPVFNGQHIDNIALKIKREKENSEADSKATPWTIMLNFDLHSLGKIKIQLSVIQQSVSATVWSEAKQTHQIVKQHINSLQKNLEQVGVHVQRLDCLLGTPPELKSQLNQPLVDIHS